MAKPMKHSKLPQTGSVEELARFWDTHDLTDFENELEEVDDRVFERKPGIRVLLEAREIEAVNELAESRGVNSSELIREWIREKLQIF
jgi:predicted DNA binding CopG/RHH family protein